VFDRASAARLLYSSGSLASDMVRYRTWLRAIHATKARGALRGSFWRYCRFCHRLAVAILRSMRLTGAPVTLDQLRSRGISHIMVTCNNYRCGHGMFLPLSRIERPGSMALANVRFKCATCGGRDTKRHVKP
jgi:hypothetical protein